jgi:hypothetical protein
MNPPRSILVVLVLSIVLSLAAAGFVFVAHENNQPLNAGKLRIYTDGFRSMALSANMLAGLAEDRNVTRVFFDSQCEFMVQNGEQNEESLRQEQPEQVLQELHQQSIDLSSQVVEQTKKLCASLDDPASFKSSRAKLDQLTTQLSELQKQL